MKRLAMGIALLLALAEPAAGEPLHLLCPEYTNDAEILERFRGDPDATALEAGTSVAGALFRLMRWASGSWNIVLIIPGGSSCIVAQGEGWTILIAEQGGTL